MISPHVLSTVEVYAKRDVHSIYLTKDSDQIDCTKLNFENKHFCVVKLDHFSGLKDPNTKKEIYKYAANVIIFNLIIDFDLGSQERDECKKVVHHLKNLGFARILNCRSRNSQILKNLCLTYNVYYEEIF